MSLPPPKPLSVSTSPSMGPAAARAATQDAQIAQLVQQVRTLEHDLEQQRVQLEAEKARGIATVNQIKEQWRAESKEWRDGCDSLQSKHRLAHLGTRMTLEHERALRLEDKEALVREKLARLFREHKITLFQARETDLVAQVAMLEEEVDVYREELTQIVDQHATEVAHLTTRLTKSEALQQERVEQLGDFTQERTVLETELTNLRASAASNAKQIERLTLQLETLRTQNAATEDRNKDLQHQVDKWQSLEGKGEKEVVELRKRRIDLEVRVKELEVSLRESRGLDKKIAKLEASLLETHEQVEQVNQEYTDAETAAEQARKHAAKLERQVLKLQTALEAEKTRSAEALQKERESKTSKPPSSKGRLRVPSAIQEASEPSGDEIVEVSRKPSPRKQKPSSTRSEAERERRRVKAPRSPPESPESEPEPEETENNVEGNTNPSVEEDHEIVEGEEDGEIQEIQPPVKRNRRPRYEDRDKDSDIEEIPPPTQKKPKSKTAQTQKTDDATVAKKPRSRTAKAKATDAEEEDDQEQETRPKKRARSKPASTNGGPSGKKRIDVTDAEDEGEEPQRKKKRKLNVAGGAGVFSGPAGFTFDQDGVGDLGIPSVLSPVKEGQPVPARSGSNSILGGWKLWKT